MLRVQFDIEPKRIILFRGPLRRRCSSRLLNTQPRAVLHDRLLPSQLSSGGRRSSGGSGISNHLTWRRGSPRRLAFQASRVRQLTVVKISFVWSVVKTSDVMVYLWKTLSSYRGEPLMQSLPSPVSPCPSSWSAASGSSTPHLITVLSSSLVGQKSVQTSCMRRHSSSVTAGSSTVAARHNKSSRRGTSINSSGLFSVLPIGATFLSSFLSLRPVLHCVDFVINPAEIKTVGRG